MFLIPDKTATAEDKDQIHSEVDWFTVELLFSVRLNSDDNRTGETFLQTAEILSHFSIKPVWKQMEV